MYEQDIGEALETLTDLVLECAPVLTPQMDHADYVRPADIELYAELGQLTRYCDDSILELIKGAVLNFLTFGSVSYSSLHAMHIHTSFGFKVIRVSVFYS